MGADDELNGSKTVSNFQLWNKLNDIQRDQEAVISEVRGDVRALRQTLDEKVVPKLVEHDRTLEVLRTRFVYALTIIGSSIGAVVYLAFAKGGIGG